MAKINETVFTIKVSELLRDDAEPIPVFTDDTIKEIQQVLEQLAGQGKLVEMTKQ